MKKPISREMHGFTDYSYIPFAGYAPELIGFTENKTATILCKLLSAGILASSLVTRAEWGFYKRMPYKTHLLLDTIGGITALSAPFVFGFANNKKARNTFFGLGAFGLLAGLLSEREEMPVTKEAFEETKDHLLAS